MNAVFANHDGQIGELAIRKRDYATRGLSELDDVWENRQPGRLAGVVNGSGRGRV